MKIWGIGIALLLALCATEIGLATRVQADQNAPQNTQNGVAEGILVAKGEGWIALQADGSQGVVKLVPRWVGGLPGKGGGFDKRILAVINQLVIGSRLKVAWMREGQQLFVVDIQVLPAREGGEGAEGGEGQTEKGVAVGVVTAKGEDWISIRADGEQEAQKLIPPWIGGTPDQGGGYDKKVLQQIAGASIGARVRVEWMFQEHLRVVSLQPAQ